MKNLKKMLAVTLAGAACLAGTASAAITPPVSGTFYGMPLKGMSENDISSGGAYARWDKAALATGATAEAPGAIRFDYVNASDAQAKVAAAYARNLVPLITLDFDTRDPVEFAEAALAAVNATYPYGARHFEIGNEWNTRQFWDFDGSTNGDLAVNPEVAADITAVTGYVLKAWYPNATKKINLVIGGPAPGDWVPTTNTTFREKEIALGEYFKRMDDRNTTNPYAPSTTIKVETYTDTVGIHPYATSKPSGSSTDPGDDGDDYHNYGTPTYLSRGFCWAFEVAQSCPSAGPGTTPNFPSVMELFTWKPIWATEYANWSTGDETPAHDRNSSEYEQASNLWYTLNAWNGWFDPYGSWLGQARTFFYYNVQDKDCGNAGSDDCGSGLYRTDGTAKTTSGGVDRAWTIFHNHVFS